MAEMIKRLFISPRLADRMNRVGIRLPAVKKLKDESGFYLVEVLVSAFILITVGVGVLGGLSLTSKVIVSTDRHETAHDLAVAEMEYIKSLSYSTTHYDYNASLIPAGSSFAVSVVNPPQSLQDGNLQLITVIISSNSTEVTRLSDYKVNW